MHFDDTAFTRLASAKFAEIRTQAILPEELIALVEQILPLQRKAQAEAKVSMPGDDALATEAAMFAGSPLLLRKDFPCDLPQAIMLLPQLLSLLGASGGEAATAAESIGQAIASGELAPAALLRARPEGDETVFETWRARLPGSPRALDFITTSALSPSLRAAAQALAPRLPKNLPHEHGHCPLCGSLSYISTLRDKEGKRHGVCSFCGFEHRIRRIACPYCDEGRQDALKLFRVAEYPDVRVDVCGTCSMYIKTIDLREADGEALPELLDMATVALDVLAQQQGYKRPTLSAWGF